MMSQTTVKTDSVKLSTDRDRQSTVMSTPHHTAEINAAGHLPDNLLKHMPDEAADAARCQSPLAGLSNREHGARVKVLGKHCVARTPVKRYSDCLSYTNGTVKSTTIGDKLTKAVKTRSVDMAVPLKRTRSFQNISSMLSDNVNTVYVSNGLRRSSSFQNVDLHSDFLTTSPVSISIACNAELLANFERERRHFENRISELLQLSESRRTEAERLKIELREVRAAAAACSASTNEICVLRRENELMRDRLAEFNVTIEHFTDAEKLTLLQSREASEHDSLSAVGRETSKLSLLSDAEDSVRENEGDFALSGGSVDANWDRGSEGALTIGSGSEVSVACLQDRLLAMEETQYSTSEELAATLQELGDLQNAINSLTAENERLADERAILLESLCAQTQKLENARHQIQHLKTLLFRDSTAEERSENECQLMALVRSTEEEREELLLKQAELCNTIELLEAEKRDLYCITVSLREQLADLSSEKCRQDMQLTSLTEQALQHADELQHYRLTAERSQSSIAHNIAAGENCSQCGLLEELLSNSRLELTSTASECIQLRSQLADVEDQLKEFEHSALSQSAEMDRRLREAERDSEEARSAMSSLRVSSSRAAEEQRAVIARLESDLRIAHIRLTDAERSAAEMSSRFETERKEWESFQRDLQTAVVVAVDIRSEAQEDMERLKTENQMLHENECSVRRELEATQSEVVRLRKLQEMQDANSPSANTGSTIRDSLLNSVDCELTYIHQPGRRASDLCLSSSKSSAGSLSVQRLISSIEEQIKAGDVPLADSSTHDMPSGRASNGQMLKESVSSAITKPVLMRYWSQPATKPATGSANGKRQTIDGSTVAATDEAKCAAAEGCVLPPAAGGNATTGARKPLAGILTNKSGRQKTIHADSGEKHDKTSAYLMTVSGHMSKPVDPLASLAKQLGGSKRNALLKWCQNRTATYTGIDITNFSSSWNDGLAFCALMHSYLPESIPYKDLSSQDKIRNFSLAFGAAETVGIPCSLNMNEMISTERPDWQAVMAYVTSIYRRFEVDCEGQC